MPELSRPSNGHLRSFNGHLSLFRGQKALQICENSCNFKCLLIIDGSITHILPFWRPGNSSRSLFRVRGLGQTSTVNHYLIDSGQSW